MTEFDNWFIELDAGKIVFDHVDGTSCFQPLCVQLKEITPADDEYFYII